GWVVVVAVFVANVVEAILHGNDRLKGAFNVAQWAAATGAGALVLAALRQGQQLNWQNVGALVAAFAVVLLVNHLAFSTVVALAPASALLGAAVDPLEVADAFLEQVRGCFEAEAAELVLVDNDQAVHRVPAGAAPLAADLADVLLALPEPARLTAQAHRPGGW